MKRKTKEEVSSVERCKTGNIQNLYLYTKRQKMENKENTDENECSNILPAKSGKSSSSSVSPVQNTVIDSGSEMEKISDKNCTSTPSSTRAITRSKARANLHQGENHHNFDSIVSSVRISDQSIKTISK